MDHQPVLVDRVVELLVPPLEHGGYFVDCTLGRAGHALRILEAAPHAQLVGLDRDAEALRESAAVLAAHESRCRLVRADFAGLTAVLERLGVPQVAGVLLDLGVSSPQLDRAERGFSFRAPGPLDMRMDTDRALSAEDVVNRYPEHELQRVIARHGEERFARRIARAIIAARPVRTTVQLADVVKNAIPAAARRTGGHPARRTFQAIRIEVNDELRQLEQVLPQIVEALEPGGRMAVLSYHSLEDRVVKRFLADEARGCVCPPDLPVCRCGSEARVRILTRKAITPDENEVEANPRASAAKLRAAERIVADINGLTELERRSA